ncbi:MAG: segregation/condensation protein A [Chloroflexota bacterium]|nr:MAG: segregation/condensation protein A [Chloroflexota bacterium]
MEDYSIRLPEFEGPLDLLLQMIERAELDITRVSLAQVADQYLEFVSKPGLIELSALADYLVLAARLILIKSRSLLPRVEQEAESEIEDSAEALARQLREYKMFKQIAMQLRAREQQNVRVYPRRAPTPKPTVTRPTKIAGLTYKALFNAFKRSLGSNPTLPNGAIIEPLKISIHHRIARIRELTTRQTRVPFTELLTEATSRVEIIVTFLAILESLKRKLIFVAQDDIFGEIYLLARDEANADVPTLQELEDDFA